MRARRAFLRAVCAGVRCWLRAVCAVLAAAFAAGCGRSCGCGCVASACGERSCGSAPSRVVCALFAPAVAALAVRILRAAPGMEHERTRRARDGSRRARGCGGVVDARAASGGGADVRGASGGRVRAQARLSATIRAGRARLPYARGACARAAGVRADASGAGSLQLSLVGRCARGKRRRPAAAADGWPRRPHLHAFGGTRCTGQTAIRGKNFNLCAHKLKFLPPSGAETGIADVAAGAASRKTAGQRNMTCRVIFRGCRIS